MSQVTADLGELFAAAAAAGRALGPDPAAVLSPEWAPAGLEAAIRRGEPAVLAAPPRVPPAAFCATCRQMAAVVQQHHPGAAAGALALMAHLDALPDAAAGGRGAPGGGDAARGGAPGAAGLALAVLQGNTEYLWRWAAKAGLPAGPLYLVAELAARPFLAAYAAALRGRVSLARWQRRYCPVCGRRPNVGFIDGENRKYLHCPGCGTSWEVRRFQCSLCCHDGRGALHFFTAAEWPHWRVEICTHCQGYMKVLDQRQPGAWTPDLDLFVADGRTLVLDLAAQQRGFRRPEQAGGDGH